MKLNINTYYLILALLCTSAIFGAASSGATPVEQYQQALQQGNINAIVAAYAELPQEMRRAPEIYAPLVRALLADKPTDEATIATLQNIFINAQHPVLKWVLRNDRTELDQRLNQLEQAQTTLHDDQENGQAPEIMATLEERYQAAQQEQMAPASSSEQISLSDDRELKRTERTGLLATLEQSAKRQRMEKNIPTIRKLALRSITKDIAQKGLLNVQSAEDLHALIASIISPEQLKTLQGGGLDEMIFNHLANVLAKDYFLKLSPEKESRKPELLPEWLREHFTGVSIQDLIDYETDFQSLAIKDDDGRLEVLWLNKMYINDLTGIEKIPGITEIIDLDLSKNLITSIETGIFNQFPHLIYLKLSGNLITSLEPDTFNGLSQLEKLNLRHNQITYLEPGVFNGLSGLLDLILSHNRITSLRPGVFNGLNGIRNLELSNNQITSINPDVFNLPMLDVLDLNDNQIITIKSEDFANLSGLGILELNHNKIRSLEPGVFNHVQRLDELRLSDNQISSIKPGAITGLVKLNDLSLSGNQITSLEAGAITNLPKLLELALYDNQITTIKAGAITNVPRLVTLYLNNNRIISFEPDIFTNLQRLRMLWLQNNSIVQNQGERARVEEEVRAATNGQGNVIWSVEW